MITNIAFVVPGEPGAKQRPRATSIGGHARMYTPAQTVRYESLVAMCAGQAMRSGPPLAGPMAIEIEAVHSIPASWSKKRRAAALAGLERPFTSRKDWDNIGKIVCDAINGIVWLDDRQVCDGRVIKRYGETPGVHVRVATLAPAVMGMAA